ncbi:MAG TPA: pyridoxal-dependent decarboxylase [Acidimicrobiia bacterium]|nr:pyridoxal-dependent decarboxylase [Acidimicrobiia bacterium]
MSDSVRTPNDETPGHMSAEDFRRRAHQVVDWVADYMGEVENLPIIPEVKPGDIMRLLADHAPENAEPFDEIFADLDRVVKPGLTGWQHPGWFAFFPGNISGPAILAEMAASGLGQQGMLWSTSPVSTEIEMRVLDWLVELMGLPATWMMAGPGGGVIQTTASDSTHTALVVGRHLKSDVATLDSVVAYTSSQSHSSIEKGAKVAGYRHIRTVEVDASHAMVPERLEAAIAADLADGLVPAFVCSTVGTTGTTAIDPVEAIGKISRRHRMWHHVDAAFAGSAMICPEFRQYQPGLELVDSYVFNPHKWLLTNVDCSVLYVADRAPLLATMSILPPYLRGAAAGSSVVVDYRDWHVALGRRFRSLKLWWVLRAYGAEGLRSMIREHVRLAQEFSKRVDDHPSLELVAPVPFSLVCFRHVDGDDATTRLAKAINDSGHSYVTPSVLDGRPFIRVSIGQTRTNATHVDRLWDLIAGSV